ncbi:HAD family hydrolase [Chloroflexota bacterium]
MRQIELVSFDAEGTLVTPDFSEAIWHEAIPGLYAQKKGLDLAQAKKCITDEYNKVGVHRLEWYDIEYWFSCLGLGSSEPVIRSCLNKIAHYPEVIEVLSSLAGEYPLIVASGTPLKLLDYLLRDIKPYFVRIFSSISNYRQVKTPDFYYKLCEEMSVKPGQVIHVGDSWQFDFVNARQAGMNALYVDRSGANREDSLGDLTRLKDFLTASA